MAFTLALYLLYVFCNIINFVCVSLPSFSHSKAKWHTSRCSRRVILEQFRVNISSLFARSLLSGIATSLLRNKHHCILMDTPEMSRPEELSEAVWAALDEASRKQILAALLDAKQIAYQEGLMTSTKAAEFTALLHPNNLQSVRTAQEFLHKVCVHPKLQLYCLCSVSMLEMYNSVHVCMRDPITAQRMMS